LLHVQTLILKYCLNLNEKKKDCGVKIKIIQCEKKQEEDFFVLFTKIQVKRFFKIKVVSYHQQNYHQHP